ncbi:hypothetical protein B0H67DRAFT_481228 [Lasiosphaeris hirsuta]|uniref:C2H2-type domain-containing protein n=1 Tax=Lasiosphaeris hirsuta TaxID=260670 RepID=A0AA40B022_9PEZI|nr:hypothetical protein B0H67DRAFT_481228 [Lasiosphaeris hirsuta]
MVTGLHICECCPIKSKKFDTEGELKIHEAENPYECSFCGNRFKNKNEAERHQNSLHLCRDNWSCSVMTGYEQLFFDSRVNPGESDTCGYCGEEFPRSGCNATGVFITDHNWEERIHHLQGIHRFRECNPSKKFFSADHFRQHLKYGHAGISGIWTDELEHACMKEKEPPVQSVV